VQFRAVRNVAFGTLVFAFRLCDEQIDCVIMLQVSGCIALTWTPPLVDDVSVTVYNLLAIWKERGDYLFPAQCVFNQKKIPLNWQKNTVIIHAAVLCVQRTRHGAVRAFGFQCKSIRGRRPHWHRLRDPWQQSGAVGDIVWWEWKGDQR